MKASISYLKTEDSTYLLDMRSTITVLKGELGEFQIEKDSSSLRKIFGGFNSF